MDLRPEKTASLERTGVPMNQFDSFWKIFHELKVVGIVVIHNHFLIAKSGPVWRIMLRNF